MRILLVCATALLATPVSNGAAQETGVAEAGSFVGSWAGTLDAGDGVRLRLHLVLSEAEGVLSVAETSVVRWNWETHRTDGFSYRLGAPVVTVNGGAISVPMPDFDASYAGTWSQGDGRITGAFTQAGETFPLVLERSSEDEAGPGRPRTREEPLPYVVEEVTYVNPDGGHTLAGTFTRPASGDPFPSVILIPGSGPYARHRTAAGRNLPAVLADHLTRSGIAVLHYDRRGVGESKGDFSAATSEDFASDVLAGVAFLTTRDDVDPGGIGLAGQSEGGLIAPMAAVLSSDISYIVLLAGPGVNGERIARVQVELRARAGGASETAVAETVERQRAIVEILKSAPDPERAREEIEAIIRTRFERASHQERRLYGITDEATLARITGELVEQLTGPWHRFFLTYEPAETLERVTVPVLAINGTRDLHVPHEENLREIEAALKRGGNTRYEIRALPDINHWFQRAETGAGFEAQTIGEAFAVEALELIADWILKTVGR